MSVACAEEQAARETYSNSAAKWAEKGEDLPILDTYLGKVLTDKNIIAELNTWI